MAVQSLVGKTFARTSKGYVPIETSNTPNKRVGRLLIQETYTSVATIKEVKDKTYRMDHRDKLTSVRGQVIVLKRNW